MCGDTSAQLHKQTNWVCKWEVVWKMCKIKCHSMESLKWLWMIEVCGWYQTSGYQIFILASTRRIHILSEISEMTGTMNGSE